APAGSCSTRTPLSSCPPAKAPRFHAPWPCFFFFAGCSLVIEHHLGDAGRYDADTVLAGIMTLDDGDVGIAHVSLELVPQLAHPLAAPLEQCRHGNSADPCRGPHEHLRGPVVADHLRFDMCGIRTEMLAEVNAKALAVEICARAQHPRPRERPRARYRRADRADRRPREEPRWAPPARSSARYRDRFRRSCRAV